MAAPQVDFGRLAGVLFLVCFGAALVLAVVNSQTKPVIDEIQAGKAASARLGVLPAGTQRVDADPFHVALGSDLKEQGVEVAGVLSSAQEKSGTLEVFRGYDAKEGGEVTGYAFECELPDGYSGSIKFMVGVSYDEDLEAFRMAGSTILVHAETPGLGANIVHISYSTKKEAKQAMADYEKAVDAGVADEQGLVRPLPAEPGFLKQFRGRPVEEIALRKEDPPGELDALTAATITSKAYSQAARRILRMCNRNADAFLNPASKEPEAPSGETDGEGDSHGE